MKFPFFITIFIVITSQLLFCTSCMKEPIKKDCPYMYKLLPIAFDTGIDSESCMLLASLQNMAQITPPVTIAAIRSQLETGQVQTFSDAGFDQFLNRLYSLPLDTTALTTDEISILNTIFAYLDPPVGLSCCSGVGFPVAPVDVDLVVSERIGSSALEYSIDLFLNSLFSCDIYDVEATLIVPFGAPAPVVNPIILDKLGCSNGKQSFKELWLEFPSTPVGFGYSFICNFRDELGASLSVVNIPHAF